MNPYTVGGYFVAGRKFKNGPISVGLGSGDVNQVPAWPYNQNLVSPYAGSCKCQKPCWKWQNCPYGPYGSGCDLLPGLTNN